MASVGRSPGQASACHCDLRPPGAPRCRGEGSRGGPRVRQRAYLLRQLCPLVSKVPVPSMGGGQRRGPDTFLTTLGCLLCLGGSSLVPVPLIFSGFTEHLGLAPHTS